MDLTVSDLQNINVAGDELANAGDLKPNRFHVSISSRVRYTGTSVATVTESLASILDGFMAGFTFSTTGAQTRQVCGVVGFPHDHGGFGESERGLTCAQAVLEILVWALGGHHFQKLFYRSKLAVPVLFLDDEIALPAVKTETVELAVSKRCRDHHFFRREFLDGKLAHTSEAAEFFGFGDPGGQR